MDKRKGAKEAAVAPNVKRPAATEEREEGPFSKSWYWSTLAISLVSLVLVWLYFSGNAPTWIQFLYWATGIMAAGLLLWAALGLLNRYRVFERIGSARDEAPVEDGGDEEVVYRENIVVRIFKLIGRLISLVFLLVWNIFLRVLFIVEITTLQTIILAYDLIYYILYAAWTLAYYASRLSARILRWALRVAWKILRILTYLPVAKTLWRKSMRPTIMGKYNHRVAHIKARLAARLEQQRRIAQLKGLDPDKWQADYELRHHFPLPHPHEARKGLRERIERRQRLDYNRRDRWSAYRKGIPLPPKLHLESVSAKAKREKREKAKADSEAAGGTKRSKADLESTERPGRRGATAGAKAAAHEK